MKVGELFKAVVNAGVPMDAEVVVAPEGALEGDATAAIVGAEPRTLAKSGSDQLIADTEESSSNRVRALVLRTRA